MIKKKYNYLKVANNITVGWSVKLDAWTIDSTKWTIFELTDEETLYHSNLGWYEEIQ